MDQRLCECGHTAEVHDLDTKTGERLACEGVVLTDADGGQSPCPCQQFKDSGEVL